MGIFTVDVNIYFFNIFLLYLFVEDEEIKEQTPSSFFKSNFSLFFLSSLNMLFSRGTIMVVGTLAGACAGFYALNVASQNRTV